MLPLLAAHHTLTRRTTSTANHRHQTGGRHLDHVITTQARYEPALYAEHTALRAVPVVGTAEEERHAPFPVRTVDLTARATVTHQSAHVL